ncbi:MAG: hypothetical protein FWC41_11355 [Firmicutes bacterium]|nr:hypothetical protein [Bacillota bacterium]
MNYQKNAFTDLFGDVFGTSSNTGSSSKYKPSGQTDIQPYIARIKRLEAEITFLVRKCTELSLLPHQKNSDYWREQVRNYVS